jgi:hypothetical protein
MTAGGQAMTEDAYSVRNRAMETIESKGEQPLITPFAPVG